MLVASNFTIEVTTVMSFCENLFDNKLLICGLLLMWTVLSSSVFCAIMIQDYEDLSPVELDIRQL